MNREPMDETRPDADRLQRYLERAADGEPLERLVAELAREPELAALVALGARAASDLPVAAPAAMRVRHEQALRSRIAQLRAPRAGAAPRRGGPLAWLTAGARLPRPAVALGALVLAVGLLATSGVVVAAASLPGQPLYGVKRAVESARIAVTFDPVDRVALRLSFVAERIDEIRALIDRGVMPDPAVIDALAALYAAAERDAAAAGLSAAELAARRAADAEALGALGRTASPAVRAWLAQALTALGEGAVAPPAEIPPPAPSAGDGDAPAGPRVGPTVARPAEAPAATAPSDPPLGASPPATPVALPVVAATVAPPPSPTEAPVGGSPGAAPREPSAEPPAAPTEAPPPALDPPADEPDPLATERARERNTPPPPQPGHPRPPRRP